MKNVSSYMGSLDCIGNSVIVFSCGSLVFVIDANFTRIGSTMDLVLCPFSGDVEMIMFSNG